MKKVEHIARFVVNTRLENSNMKKKKRIFGAIKLWFKNEQRRKSLVALMITRVNKFFLYHSFRRFRLKASWITAMKNKDKIEGAYLLLSSYKNRMKNFDQALR